ncbi:MAG: hypothetical protein AAF693_17130 [Bacteroidota bacterium]
MRSICIMIFLAIGCNPPKGTTSSANLSAKDVIQVANERYELAEGPLFRLDQEKFNDLLKSLSSEELRNDLYQPLQFRYYDSAGKLKVLYANCDVPYKKKKGEYIWYWNKYGTFNSFPPTEPVPNSYLEELNISEELSSYVPLNTEEFRFNANHPSIVVFWSHNLSKQSLNLIELVKNYSTNTKTNYLYVHVE